MPALPRPVLIIIIVRVRVAIPVPGRPLGVVIAPVVSAVGRSSRVVLKVIIVIPEATI